YENRDGSAASGQLVWRTEPRMVQVGKDSAGHPVFQQDKDPDSGELLTDTFLSLEGAGLGISTAGQTATNTTHYYGVELQAIENDPNPLVSQFLTQKAIVIATGNPVAVPGQPGQFYYQAAFAPILVDTDPAHPGSQVDVRTVVLDSTGNIVRKLIQIKGTPE